MPRSSQPEPPRPTRLALSAADVRARIQARLDGADSLVRRVSLFSVQDLEIHRGEVRQWSSVTYELLRRLFDSDEYADAFFNSRRTRMESQYMSPAEIFNLVQEGLRNQVRELQTILAMVDVLEEIPEPIRPTSISRGVAPPSRPNVVHVTNSTIGTLNLGEMRGSIETKINSLKSSEADIKTAFAQVMDAITSAPGLDDSQRREGLEDLDLLAEQAELEPSERKVGLITTVVGGLSRILSVSDQAYRVWQEWQPALDGFLRGHLG